MVTANGEVRTNEEAQVFVHDLHLFVTVQILEETLAVLSSGKLCDDQWGQWSKATADQEWEEKSMQCGKLWS